MGERDDGQDPKRDKGDDARRTSYAKIGLEEAGVGLLNALGDGLGLLLERGQRELELAAETGRSQYELRQLQRDREILFTKLGRQVDRLVQAGELSHPTLEPSCERIRDIDARIDEIEEELAAARAAQDEAGEDGAG